MAGDRYRDGHAPQAPQFTPRHQPATLVIGPNVDARVLKRLATLFGMTIADPTAVVEEALRRLKTQADKDLTAGR